MKISFLISATEKISTREIVLKWLFGKALNREFAKKLHVEFNTRKVVTKPFPTSTEIVHND